MAGLDMSNLGIALGAGVDEWHRQKDELRQDQRAARDDEQFAWQRDQYARQKAAYDRSQQLQSQRDALLKEYADHDAYVAGLDNVPDEQLGEYIKQGITKYNTSPLFKNGYFANATVLNGQPVIVHGDMARKSSEIIPITRDGVKAGATHMSDMLLKQLAMLSPEDFQTYTAQERQVGLERDKIGIQRTTADAAMRNAITQEQFRQDSIDERRRDREENVNYMQDGTGRILGFRQGKLIGAFGSARPVMGGGGGGGADHSLSPQEQAQLGSLLAEYDAEKDPAKQAAIARRYQLAQSNMMLSRGRVPNLPAPMFKGSPLDEWETPVKLKTVGKDGSEMERTVPLRLVDPAGYAAAARAKAYDGDRMGAAFGQEKEKPAAQGPRDPWREWLFPLPKKP